jgi:hypothetical protein
VLSLGAGPRVFVASEPLVNGVFEWVKAASPVTRPDSPLGKALGYAIRQEARLRVFLGVETCRCTTISAS